MYYIVINKYYTNLIKQELVVMLNSHIKTKTQKNPQTFNFSSTPNWKNRRIVLAQLIEKKMKIVSDVNL